MPVQSVDRFRKAFFATWLVYDLFDLWTASTATFNWGYLDDAALSRLSWIQFGLILSQGLILFGRFPRLLTWIAIGLRAWEIQSYLFLNDFMYGCVTMVILAQFAQSKDDPNQVTAWPRDVLRYETAWIYFATGMFKLNPVWLSGGHLYVRHKFTQVAQAWPYPEFYSQWLDSLPFHSVMAKFGAGSEILLALFIALRAPWWASLTLASGIHVYAAFGLNVWFFGVSMLAQVAFVTLSDSRAKHSHTRRSLAS